MQEIDLNNIYAGTYTVQQLRGLPSLTLGVMYEQVIGHNPWLEESVGETEEERRFLVIEALKEYGAEAGIIVKP